MNVVEALGIASAVLALLSVLLVRAHLPAARLEALDNALLNVEAELDGLAESGKSCSIEEYKIELAE